MTWPLTSKATPEAIAMVNRVYKRHFDAETHAAAFDIDRFNALVSASFHQRDPTRTPALQHQVNAVSDCESCHQGRIAATDAEDWDYQP